MAEDERTSGPITKKRSAALVLEQESTTPGTVFVFGSGDTGQLGLGDSMLSRKRPMPLKVLDDKKVVDVACGGMHTLAVTEDGQVRKKNEREFQVNKKADVW
jgi:regulator of chromosome condensation